MFLRIFRYRVRPELRDRHLAVQARAAKLYAKHVRQPPGYFRSALDPNAWVELHRYTDKQECHKVAAAVAADRELAGLWKEFQDTLDPGYPTTLEEFNEYELPASVNTSPFAQPPIDSPANPTSAPPPAQNRHTVAQAVEVEPASESAPPPVQEGNRPLARYVQPDAPEPDNTDPRDEITISDDGADAPPTGLSYRDGVREVEPERPRDA